MLSSAARVAFVVLRSFACFLLVWGCEGAKREFGDETAGGGGAGASAGAGATAGKPGNGGGTLGGGHGGASSGAGATAAAVGVAGTLATAGNAGDTGTARCGDGVAQAG